MKRMAWEEMSGEGAGLTFFLSPITDRQCWIILGGIMSCVQPAARHHHDAAHHYEKAARHHREAERHVQALDPVTAADHAHLSGGHCHEGDHFAMEACKARARHHDI